MSEYLDAFVQYATGKRLHDMSDAEQQARTPCGVKWAVNILAFVEHTERVVSVHDWAHSWFCVSQEWMSDFHVDPETGKPAPLTRQQASASELRWCRSVSTVPNYFLSFPVHTQFSNHLDEDARSYAEDDAYVDSFHCDIRPCKST